MSLLQEAMESFVIMNKQAVNDGYGGVTTVWTEGATFKGAIVHDTSSQALIAQSLGVTSMYTLTTRKSLILEFHDVVKRVSDGAIFRVTTNGKDEATPQSAGLDMRQVKMEAWTLG